MLWPALPGIWGNETACPRDVIDRSRLGWGQAARRHCSRQCRKPNVQCEQTSPREAADQIVAVSPGCGAHPATKRMMTRMDIELLVVPECPNGPVAAALLRTALDDVGLTGSTFRTTVIDTQQRAVQRGFTGSPTILIGGLDPFVEPG